MASSATDITMPDTFPQFDNLPKELQLMIWGFSIPGRRGLEVKREPMKKLGPPAMWYACKDSRKIYREQRASIVTKVENNHEQSQRSRLYGEFDPGWFDPERDVLIWSDPVNAVAPFQLYRGYLPSLKSVTLMDLRYKQVNHDGTPTDIEYCTPLWTSIDDFRLGGWFHPVIEHGHPITNINIFRDDTRHKEEQEPNALEISSRSSAVRQLFGFDSVYLVDLQDEAQVNKVLSSLAGEESAKPALEALKWVHADVKRNDYRYCRELLERLKYLWLRNFHFIKNGRGIPTKEVEQRYFWNTKARVFACQKMAGWSDDDPVIRRMLEGMPKITSVYVLMTSNK